MAKKLKKKGVKSEDIVKVEHSNPPNKKNIYFVKNISMQPNQDPEYKEIGVVNFSVPGALSGINEVLTEDATFFGFVGFKKRVYNLTRIKALDKLNLILKENQKICNLKIQLKIAVQGNNSSSNNNYLGGNNCNEINPLESFESFLLCSAMNIRLPRGSLFFVHVFGTLFEKIPTISDEIE